MTPAVSNERAMAMMVGVAIGDALASPSNGKPRDSYDQIRGYRGTAEGAAGMPGRATGFAELTADAILTRGHFIRDLKWQGEASITAGHPLLRAVPIVIFAHANFKYATYACQVAVQGNPPVQALVGCAGLFGAALFSALHGRGKEEALYYFRDRRDFGPWEGRERDKVRSDGFCVTALKAMLWAIDSTNSATDAIFAAANLGGESSLIAALTGALAGAIYGAWIPELENGLVYGYLEPMRIKAFNLVSAGDSAAKEGKLA